MLTTAAHAADAAEPPTDWMSPAPLAWSAPHTFNWSELPVRLNLHDYIGYNDNILGAYPGYLLPKTETKGDWFNRVDVGASSKFYAGAQEIFADATYTDTIYRHDTGFDTHGYLVDAGVNWKAASRCQGVVTALAQQTQSPVVELLAPGIDNVRTLSATETGACTVYDNSGFVVNSGWSQVNHDALVYQVNNSDSAYVQGGFRYNLSGPDNAQVLVRYTETNYPDRFAALGLKPAQIPAGLRQTNHQLDYQILYTRTFSDKLDVQATAGLTWNSGLYDIGNNAGAQKFLPGYSIAVNWRPDQKWLANLTAAHTVSVATTVIGNAQLTDAQSASLTYFWSPKLTLIGALTRTQTSGGVTLSSIPVYYGDSTSFGGSARATYLITPYTSASLVLQRSVREFAGFSLMNNVAMIGFDYKPY